MLWLPVLFLLLVPSLAMAWPANGARLTGAPREQQGPVLASDGAGGAFVAWLDYRADGPPVDYGIELYVQRVAVTGQIALGWPPDGLAVAIGPGHQYVSDMIPDGTGGVLLVCGDTGVDLGDLYLKRITAAGAMAPGWPAAGVPLSVAPGEQYNATLAGDGSGGAFVSWQYGESAYYMHVLGSGEAAPGWPVGGRLFEPTPSINTRPLMLETGTDGFLACWGVFDGPSFANVRLLAKRFTSDGLADPAWPAGGTTVCAGVCTGVPRGIVSDGAGGFYTMWEDYRNSIPPGSTSETDMYAQHVLGSGTLAPGWPVDALVLSALPGVTQWDPTLCEDGHGGVFIAWEDYRANYTQVFGLHLAADGQRHAGWPAGGRLLSNAFAYQLDPHLAWDGADGAYLTWMNYGGGAGYRGFVQHLTASGAPTPGWLPDGEPLAATGGDQYEPNLVSDGGLGVIVAWGDSRLQSPVFMDIYAQRFADDVVVAAQVSLASAEATPTEVRLRWQVSGETRASVERREGEGAWMLRTTLDADGGGYMSFTDRDVTPGGRYGYRLVFASGTRGGETSIDVPATLALALEGARPNPASGTLWLAFTLADAAPARLALFDLAGRQVIAREVGRRGAGQHLVRLDDVALSPGLYWAVLTHGARTLRTRVAVVR